MQMRAQSACWGVDNALVRSRQKRRGRQDKRTVQDPMVIAPQRDHGKPPGGEGVQEDGRALVERFAERLGPKPWSGSWPAMPPSRTRCWRKDFVPRTSPAP